jgi:hypothetical protein
LRNTRPPTRPTSTRRSTASRERRQHPERVVDVDPDVAREVVSGAPRNADERHVTLDRDLCHRSQRSVAPGHPEHFGVGLACELSDLVTIRQDVHAHTERYCGSRQLLEARATVSRAGIDEENATQLGACPERGHALSHFGQAP